MVGPLTAMWVVEAHGRWWPTYVLAAALNFVGAVAYATGAETRQLM